MRVPKTNEHGDVFLRVRSIQNRKHTTPTFSMKDIKQTITKLENDLRSVAKWCFEHQLLINPNKTKFLLIGSRPMLQNLPANISLNFLKQTINPVTSAKDLGTTFDSNL